jgi:hypothetical protein
MRPEADFSAPPRTVRSQCGHRTDCARLPRTGDGKPTLTPDDLTQILRDTCRHDAHTGMAEWDPAYGFGKVDVAAALAAIP